MPSLVDIIRNAPKIAEGGDDHAYQQIKDLDITPEMFEERDNVKNIGGTPLHWAVYRDFPKTVTLLLEKGASVEVKSKPDNYLPIHTAAMFEDTDPEIYRLLIAYGADVDAIAFTQRGPTTPFWLAHSQGHTKTLNLLVCELGADPFGGLM